MIRLASVFSGTSAYWGILWREVYTLIRSFCLAYSTRRWNEGWCEDLRVALALENVYSLISSRRDMVEIARKHYPQGSCHSWLRFLPGNCCQGSWDYQDPGDFLLTPDLSSILSSGDRTNVESHQHALCVSQISDNLFKRFRKLPYQCRYGNNLVPLGKQGIL